MAMGIIVLMDILFPRAVRRGGRGSCARGELGQRRVPLVERDKLALLLLGRQEGASSVVGGRSEISCRR
jgi:hypothetical protein